VTLKPVLNYRLKCYRKLSRFEFIGRRDKFQDQTPKRIQYPVPYTFFFITIVILKEGRAKNEEKRDRERKLEEKEDVKRDVVGARNDKGGEISDKYPHNLEVT
jgi:hypothetical protein